MLPFLTRQQQAGLRRDAKDAPLVFIMLSALILAVAWIVSWADGMSGSDLTRTALGDAFTVLAFAQAFLMASTAFPIILYAFSDPSGTRLVMGTFTASVFSLLSHVAKSLEALGRGIYSPPIPTTPGNMRFTIRPPPTIPPLRFTPGTCPQLE